MAKAELAEFIIEQMRLKRSDEGPKWAERVAEFVELGTEKFSEIKLILAYCSSTQDKYQ